MPNLDFLKTDKKTKIALLIILLISFTAGLLYYYEYSQSKTVIKKYPSNQIVEENKNEKNITVYVCGEVKTPGVYRLPEGIIIKDAVDEAGGFAPDADKNKINLAEKVYDGDKVYVPSLKKKAAAKSKKHKKIPHRISKENISSPESNYNPRPVEENDLLIDEGILEIKINGRVKK